MICKSWHEALLHTVHSCGKRQHEIAEALGVSASELSRMCCHPDDMNRRSFDIRFVGPLLAMSQDSSLLETWGSELGYTVVAGKTHGLTEQWECFERKMFPIFKKFLSIVEAMSEEEGEDDPISD